MATQAQAKQVKKSQVSRSDAVQRKETKRQIKRKTTNVAPAYLQAKLKVSAPEDPHEREADQVADNVMRMPVQRSKEGADRKIDRASLKPGITPLNRVIARVISRDSLKPGEQVIHRASLKPGEDAVQRKAEGAAPAASGGVENRINAKRGQGERLPDGVRGDMETRFGRDFSAVRIHTDKDASEMSRDIEAKAFTVGNDIFFGNGRFDANSDQGKRLLAHELTHVAQQQAPQTEQEDAQQVSRSETKAQRWSLTSWLADKAWSILKKVAPSGLYTLVKEVYNKGIFGYLKEKISAAVSSVFNGLKRGADVLSNFFASFGAMAKTAKEIIKALAAGDCKPLFAAVKQLKDAIAAAAGDAWQAIKDFFKPIGAFFSDLWASWGAPVLDWLKKTAGDVWTWLKDLGKTIWNWTKPVRDYASSAWNWLKGKLGLGGSSQGDSEGGIMGWIKEKAQSVWAKVKEVMDPVIKPVKKFAGKVMEILPIKAILNLRETVQGWLKNAESMGQAMGDDGAGVADKQISLREQILPAVVKTMQSVRNSLSSAGLWLGEKIGGLAADFTSFISGLRTHPILKHVASVLNWVETGITNLGNWAKDTVQSLFTSLGNGLVKLSQFIEPVLNTLKQVADTILNLLGKLPGLILGPLWNAIPKCIRDPLKDFVLNQILGRIPFFKQLLSVKDAWEQIKATGLRILKQVFVDGNLFGALWTLFKAILKIFGLPAKLITNIIIKGAQSLGAIIAAPLDFLINILRAMKLGFSNFFSNILTHLLKGAMDWLFGAVKNAGLTVPIDFSPKSIFTFVLDILGLTMELVWKKLAEKMDPAKVEKLKKMARTASGALEWIKVAVCEGPAALWGKIKEKLSDMWNIMLEGVIGWINTKIIAWATRWLMSLLDVTGIMPVINATIAIYKAIQSFMQHLKAMLEVVNSVLNGVADLAVGAIESAAKFLEDALANVIPIVIGFLANQAGLGNIAEKIKEILGKIRCKVEEAVGWLVGKVVETVKAFVDKVKTGVKAGVQAIKEWWKKRKNFKLKNGENHTLFLKGSENSVKLRACSYEQNYTDFVINYLASATPDHKTRLLQLASAIDSDLAGYGRVAQEDRVEWGNRMVKRIDELAILTYEYSENMPTSPASVVTYGSVNAEGFGTSVDAVILSQDYVKGQAANREIKAVLGWDIARGRKAISALGNVTHVYVKGHILNDNLGGPANVYNLTPITIATNNAHKSDAEQHVKKIVLGKSSGSDKSPRTPGIARYSVTALYQGHPKRDSIKNIYWDLTRRHQANIKRLERQNNNEPTNETTELRQKVDRYTAIVNLISYEEESLTTGFQVRWAELQFNPATSKWIDLPGSARGPAIIRHQLPTTNVYGNLVNS